MRPAQFARFLTIAGQVLYFCAMAVLVIDLFALTPKQRDFDRQADQAWQANISAWNLAREKQAFTPEFDRQIAELEQSAERAREQARAYREYTSRVSGFGVLLLFAGLAMLAAGEITQKRCKGSSDPSQAESDPQAVGSKT